MHVAADPTRCVGAGHASLPAPAVFDQDDGGTVVVLTDTPEAGQHEPVKEAVYLCPASAISIDD